MTTNYKHRIDSIAKQIGVLFNDMMDEPMGGSDLQNTQQFIRNLDDVVYGVEDALAEFRHQLLIENGEVAQFERLNRPLRAPSYESVAKIMSEDRG